MILGEVDCLSKKTGWCDASRNHFAEWLGCTPQNVTYYLQKLEKLGYLETLANPGYRSKRRIVPGRFYEAGGVNPIDGGGKGDLRVGVKGTDGGGKGDLPEIQDKIKREIQGRKEKSTADAAPAELKTTVEAEKEKKKGRTGARPAAEIKEAEISQYLQPAERAFFAEILANESWVEYLDYRKTKDRFQYKDSKSHALGVRDLFKLSDGKTGKAEEIINQSRAKGWSGLVALKTQNGTPTPTHKPGAPTRYGGNMDKYREKQAF